ncbi:hypothetical protein [Neorhizobium galegae]|uniref:hypothetical protein n=1 Tax=Neorhizobium galegae TaxID=399 RepID=UPI001270FE2F|nr:hypothetical protein [Neorhizobium galegae]KAA9384131.1 hypothetical protein F4V88_28325 [Neorhizobium galegae]MCM2498785.1 hypothetical protein [Neorhizobium galegae]
MLKIISVSLVSFGLATGVAFSQSLSNPSSSNRQNRSTDSGKPDPGPMHPPQKMDNTVTNSTRTNCPPNLATQGSATTPNKDGQSSTAVEGAAGTNTNGQSSNC